MIRREIEIMEPEQLEVQKYFRGFNTNIVASSFNIEDVRHIFRTTYFLGNMRGDFLTPRGWKFVRL